MQIRLVKYIWLIGYKLKFIVGSKAQLGGAETRHRARRLLSMLTRRLNTAATKAQLNVWRGSGPTSNTFVGSKAQLEASGFKALLALRENFTSTPRVGLPRRFAFGHLSGGSCEPEDLTTLDGGYEDTKPSQIRREITAQRLRITNVNAIIKQMGSFQIRVNMPLKDNLEEATMPVS
jgi:hypothetical protein